MANTQTVNALDLLETQHRDAEALIEKIEKTDDIDKKTELFEQLADSLAAHATIEEKLFYPAVMAKQTRELLVESVEEHLSVKRVLADMLELDPHDEHFDAKLSVLKEQIDHHAHEEEEAELFPKVKKLLDADELESLGNQMMAMFEDLLEQQPRSNVPAETGAPAPI
jgi:hemerythrin superfamily protein